MIGTRLKDLRKLFRLSKEEFGILLGISKDDVSSIETGVTELVASLIVKVCSVFNVSSDWLIFGLGEMFRVEVNFTENISSIEILSGIGQRLQKIRLKSKLSLLDFAEKLGSSELEVLCFEKEILQISSEYLLTVCRTFDVSLANILFGTSLHKKNPNTEKNEHIGKRIRLLRTEKGISQQDLAIIMGGTSSTVSLWETGAFVMRDNNLRKLAAFFNANIIWLLEGEGDKYLTSGDSHSSSISNDVISANRLRELRATLKLSISKLADLLGISPTTLKRWERKTGIPYSKIKDVAKALNVDPEWLIYGTSTKNQPLPKIAPCEPDNCTSDTYDIAKRLKEIRTESGLFQSELAKKLGVDRSSISQWERDLCPIPSAHIESICKLLHVNPEWLNEGIEPKYIALKKNESPRNLTLPIKTGEKLKELRKNSYLSKIQIAKKLKVTLPVFESWESGENNIPLRKIIEICSIFGVDLLWFILDQGPKYPEKPHAPLDVTEGFWERFDSLIDESGLTNDELIYELKGSPILSYPRDRKIDSTINPAEIRKFAKLMSANVEWLVSGIGEKYTHQRKSFVPQIPSKIRGIGSRLKEIRSDFNLTRYEFSTILNVPFYLVYHREKEEAFIPESYNLEIAKIFKVNPNWIITGTGEKHLDDALRQTEIPAST